MNIFARELVGVLASHHKELSDLFKYRNVDPPRNIPPNTVLRLKASLDGANSATLNVDQIELLTEEFGFDDADLDRLHAALVAEAIRTLIADRLEATLAEQLGELTLTLLLEEDPARVKAASESLLASVRGLPDEAAGERVLRGLPPITGERGTVSAADAALFAAPDPLADAAALLVGAADAPPFRLDVLTALSGALDAYELGVLWLAMAQRASAAARGGQAAQARAYLERAARLARTCPERADGTSEQAELLEEIARALVDAAAIG